MRLNIRDIIAAIATPVLTTTVLITCLGWIPARPVLAGGLTAPTIVNPWPGFAPGETSAVIDPIQPSTSPFGPILVAGQSLPPNRQVTAPQLYVYEPANSDGTARPSVLVAPGGGYSVTTQDIEGAEIAHWLNAQGYVAAVLYYRLEHDASWNIKGVPALQDAQRSVAYLRANAAAFGIDPSKVGMAGFSAGAHLTAWTAASYNSLSYTAVDAVDSMKHGPDFALLTYPAYLTNGDGALIPALTPVAGEAPHFISSATDSWAGQRATFASELQAVGVNTTLIPEYSDRDHGYGLRAPATHADSAWTNLASQWLSTTMPATSNSNCALLPYASTAPTIDGVSDAVWANAVTYRLANEVGTTPLGGTLSATWKGMWDNNNLYLFVSVVDNVLVSATPPVNGDAVELYVDANDSKSSTYSTGDYQFVFGWNNPAVYEYANGLQGVNTAGMRFATAKTGSGYTTEIAIPWSTLGKSPGDLVGLDVHVDDSNNVASGYQATIMWNSVLDTLQHNPGLAGTALLLPTPATPVPANPSLLSAGPGNNQVSLTWTGNSPADSYNIFRGTASGGESPTALVTGVVGASFTDTNAVDGTLYYYDVVAVNSAGSSTDSNEISATPEPTVPPAPTGLTAVPGNIQVSLAWAASCRVTSYNVTPR